MLNRVIYLSLAFFILLFFSLSACKSMKSSSKTTDGQAEGTSNSKYESGKGEPTATDKASPKDGGFLLPPKDNFEYAVEWLVQARPNYGVSTLPDDLFGYCLEIEKCLSTKLNVWTVSAQVKRKEVKEVNKLLRNNCHLKSVRLNEGVGAVRTWESI